MNRHSREDLDVRVRRAWPIACDTTASPPSPTRRMRTLIDERIVDGAEPDASVLGAAARRAQTPRRAATVLAGAVLVISALVLGGLVAGRFRPQDRPDQVRFADQPARDVAAAPDPDAAVRAAIAATRRAAADLTVTKVQRDWINDEERRFADVAAFTEQTPWIRSRSVDAANGDWAYADTWDRPLEYAHPSDVKGCSSFADCAESVGAIRFVDGQYYERVPEARTWEQVIADGRRGPAEIIKDGVALEGTGFLEREPFLEMLEHYDGGWTALPSGPPGSTRYRAADVDEARRLIVGLANGRVIPRAAFRDRPGAPPRPAVTTVEVWIDDASGRVLRMSTESRSTRDVTEDTTLLRQDIRLTYGDTSPVAAPERAGVVTLDQWCTRDRNARWCE